LPYPFPSYKWTDRHTHRAFYIYRVAQKTSRTLRNYNGTSTTLSMPAIRYQYRHIKRYSSTTTTTTHNTSIHTALCVTIWLTSVAYQIPSTLVAKSINIQPSTLFYSSFLPRWPKKTSRTLRNYNGAYTLWGEISFGTFVDQYVLLLSYKFQ